MFHHTHHSIENLGKGKLRQVLRDDNVLTMRKSRNKTKKELRKYFYGKSQRIIIRPGGTAVSVFNEMNIPFFHGTEA